MTNEDFKKKSRSLFRTQYAASVYFGVSLSTLKRWYAGDPIPHTAIIALECYANHRPKRKNLFNAGGSLGHKPTPCRNIGFIK